MDELVRMLEEKEENNRLQALCRHPSPAGPRKEFRRVMQKEIILPIGKLAVTIGRYTTGWALPGEEVVNPSESFSVTLPSGEVEWGTQDRYTDAIVFHLMDLTGADLELALQLEREGYAEPQTGGKGFLHPDKLDCFTVEFPLSGQAPFKPGLAREIYRDEYYRKKRGC